MDITHTWVRADHVRTNISLALFPLSSLLIATTLTFLPTATRAENGDEQLAAGYYYTCRIRADTTMGCLGYTLDDINVAPSGAFSAVAANTSDTHACAIRTDGTLACWGRNNNGQAVPLAGTFVAIGVGQNHNCAIRTDGSLACWGFDGDGQATPPAGVFIAIDGGRYHSCGVRNDGNLQCWGRNDHGQITAPVGTFLTVSSGEDHNCAIRTDGSLACWGDNAFGQASPPSGRFVSLSAGAHHDCAVRQDATVACWGTNFDGESSPPAGAFAEVHAGYQHSCGLRPSGTVECWGANIRGEAPSLAIMPMVLPGGSSTAAYMQSLSLVDVNHLTELFYTPVTPGFAVVAGQLPAGLALTAAGVLSGTPTLGGTFEFAVESEDANGFVAWRSYSLAIDGPSDATPPVIVPMVSGMQGSNGWYIDDVSVAWSVTDPESAITSTGGCAATALATDTAGTTFTCTATSGGGTDSQTVTVRRDATVPGLAPVVDPSVALLHGQGVVEPNASDSMSGIADTQCSAFETGSVGLHVGTCTATDVAGNTATATATYRVIYGFIGFAMPVDNLPTVNLATAGRAIPLKWRLVDALGAPITDLASVGISASAMNCTDGALSDNLEQYASGESTLQNLGNGNYQFNWKSPATYQDSCRQLRLDLGDSSTRLLHFRFR